MARCGCGYVSGLIEQGGGFATFMTHDMEPARSRPCGELVVLNFRAERPRCPRCGGHPTFYNDPSLRKDSGGQQTGRSVCHWGEFVLPGAEYLCPSCGEMRMTFEEWGNWD